MVDLIDGSFHVASDRFDIERLRAQVASGLRQRAAIEPDPSALLARFDDPVWLNARDEAVGRVHSILAEPFDSNRFVRSGSILGPLLDRAREPFHDIARYHVDALASRQHTIAVSMAAALSALTAIDARPDQLPDVARALDEVAMLREELRLVRVDVAALHRAIVEIAAEARPGVPETAQGDQTSIQQWRDLRALLGPNGRIVQLISDVVPADAATADTIAWQRALERAGFDAPIFARRVVGGHGGTANHINAYQPSSSDIVILKYTLWSEVAEWVRSHQMPYALLYYNVTPPAFFEPYNDALARETRLGREQLPTLVPGCVISAANSPFGARDLASAGFREPAVVPILAELEHVDFALDPAVTRELGESSPNIVSAGRIAPNKRVEHTVAAFAHYRAIEPRARLFLVGDYDDRSPYFLAVQRLIGQLDVGASVHLTGKVSRSRYATYFAQADVYLTMSEHEGFCVPLIEAGRSNLPIVARSAGAIPETAGDAAILVDQPIPAVVAELINAVVTERDLRGWLIDCGRDMAERFAYPRVEATVASFLVEATRRIRST